MKKRTQIHYVISLLFIVIFTIATTSFFVIDGGTPAVKTAITFALCFGTYGIFYFIATVSLSKNTNKPLKIMLPLLISVLIVSSFSTFIEWYYVFLEDELTGKTVKNKWSNYIMPIIMTFAFIVLLPMFQVYITKFLMVSLSKNRADELTITSFIELTTQRADIIHNKSYSVLFSKSKVFIIKFIPESEIERDIFLEGETEMSPIVKEVLDITNMMDKKLNIESIGNIVFLSNKIPEIKGKHINNFKIIKYSKLFGSFRKQKKSFVNDITIEKIKEFM